MASVTFTCSDAEKAAWQHKAGDRSLSAWMRGCLNDAANPPKSARAMPASAAPLENYIPPELPPVPPGVRTIPIAEDLALRLRERGKVAAFIRMDGREWNHPGPSPLERGCLIRNDVLAEYAQRLDMLRESLAFQTQQNAGYGPESRV